MFRGIRDKRGVFGDDSERHDSSLYQMLVNPNGTRRPDLISPNGRLSPRLSIELKSGRGGKGETVLYQMHYAITAPDDYKRLLGEELPEQGMVPGGVIKDVQTRFEGVGTERPLREILPSKRVIYYYGLVDRIDGLRMDDLDNPWSTIRCEWGNQAIFPSDYGFYSFATQYARKFGTDTEDVIKFMRDVIKQDVLAQRSNAESRKAERGCWQDIHLTDFMAIFSGDYSNLKTPVARERVDRIRRVYPQVDDLKRVEIPGPNGSTIYVLAEAGDFDLFDRQFRLVVRERVPVLEVVAEERKEASYLLDKISTVTQGTFWGEEEPRNIQVNGLSYCEVRHLNRLLNWVGPGEKTVAERYLDFDGRDARIDPEDKVEETQDEASEEAELANLPF